MRATFGMGCATRLSRCVPLLLTLVVTGCGEQPGSDIQPVVVPPGHDRSALAEPPDPALVTPHLRRRELTDEERAARARELEQAVALNTGTGGGGGGGRRFGNTAEEWIPRRNPRPSQREVERFRDELGREQSREVDPTDDPCEQYRALAAAGMNAARQPGEPELEPPSAAEMRRTCGGMPEAYRPCMAPSYFREHTEECNEVLRSMSRDGDRRMERAQEEWRAFQRGEHPSQTGAARSDDEEPG